MVAERPYLSGVFDTRDERRVPSEMDSSRETSEVEVDERLGSESAIAC